jgi:ribosomal protein L29
MAVLKAKDIKNMTDKEKGEKIKELKIELIKNKLGRESKLKTKEIKKAIARLLTLKKK